MKQRIITAFCGLPLLIAFVWFDTPWFPLLILLIAAGAVLGIVEFYRLASYAGGQPLPTFGLVWALLFIVNAQLEGSFSMPLLASAIALPLLWLLLRPRGAGVFIDWAWTLMGILYVGWMLSHYVSLRDIDHGREWVLLTLFATFACDTTAFLVGRSWGKRLMAPRISPGKTWEGTVAGFFAAIAATLIINAILGTVGLGLPASYRQMIPLGCLIGGFAVLGDLWESSLKRRAGVKDSGSLIPGHGGILDRMDSIVFTGIVAYYYVEWVI